MMDPLRGTRTLVVGTECAWQGSVLGRVNDFLYLGRILSEQDSDWPTLRRNLTRAQQKWAMLSLILWFERLPLLKCPVLLQSYSAVRVAVRIGDLGMDEVHVASPPGFPQ